MSVLEVTQLAKSFGDTQAVVDVGFRVEPGEIYGLLGPNGAGKTTSISMICGLLRPDQGSVRIKGQDLWASPEDAQRHLGVVPQEIALYDDLSGEENLIFWGKMAGLSAPQAKTRAAELLGALSLTDRAKERVKTYSGGMQRRINIGCALMHKPALLLMDEPTVGIDPQARNKILDFVADLAAKGMAVVYTSHYLEEVEQLCHRIGVIDQGRLLAEGTLEELEQRLPGDRLFQLDGTFEAVETERIPWFDERFQIIRRTPSQLLVAAKGDAAPIDSMKQLFELPVVLDNVAMKKPGLNEVFLQLTGRDLRE